MNDEWSVINVFITGVNIKSGCQTSLKDSAIAEQAVLLSPAKCAYWEIMNKTLWKAAIRNSFPETAGNQTFTQLLRLQVTQNRATKVTKEELQTVWKCCSAKPHWWITHWVQDHSLTFSQLLTLHCAMESFWRPVVLTFILLFLVLWFNCWSMPEFCGILLMFEKGYQ